MKGDIETRADIDLLLVEFYKVIIHDPEIGHHFDELDLDHHLPIIGDFWEKVLFGNPVYFNNPLAVHQTLHERFPLQPEHFIRWVEVFSQTVDALFAGEMADLAKFRARAIADNLDRRLNGGFEITLTNT
jgi:hemoglobin